MIIDQWYTSHVDKVNEALEIIKENDNKYDVEINGKIMASLDDLKTAQILVDEIECFSDRYHRAVDTFDISKELEIIKQNKCRKSAFGSYFS